MYSSFYPLHIIVLINKKLYVPDPPPCYAFKYSLLNEKLRILIFVDKLKIISPSQR